MRNETRKPTFVEEIRGSYKLGSQNRKGRNQLEEP
jgi:hypothetical protein